MTVQEAIEYLNWYFVQDDGTADKNAVKAWEVLIQEQEPVEPTKGQSQIFPENIEYYCGKCGAVVGVYDKFRRHWDVQMKYCYKCGKAVKWNVEKKSRLLKYGDQDAVRNGLMPAT